MFICIYIEWLMFFRVPIFPNFSFLSVSVSNISVERTYFFPFLIYPFDVDFKF